MTTGSNGDGGTERKTGERGLLTEENREWENGKEMEAHEGLGVVVLGLGEAEDGRGRRGEDGDGVGEDDKADVLRHAGLHPRARGRTRGWG